jgi:hypothetical protein
MARFTVLLTLVALALPAAASARPAEEAALGTKRYYSSYGADPPPLVAGGLGAYAARSARPRGVGA